MQLIISAARTIAPRVREFVLRDPGDAGLSSFAPGSHVVIRAGAVRNAYSLTSEGAAPREYRISVLELPGGAGGSVWLHRAAVGTVLDVEAPRSAFAPVAVARRHLLIAGGIGVTPILAHARAARRWQRPFDVIFGHSPGCAPHLTELRELAGDCLQEFTDRGSLLAAATTALRNAPLGTHLYLCGPTGMLSVLRDDAAAAGWPEERVHEERFAAAELSAGDPFEVRLSSTGKTLTVASGQSMLDRLIAEGIPVAHQCRQGVCGECIVAVRRGRVDHRDHYLSASERDTCVMPCVSRAAGDLVELEL